jgi:hypothetical protein
MLYFFARGDALPFAAFFAPLRHNSRLASRAPSLSASSLAQTMLG